MLRPILQQYGWNLDNMAVAVSYIITRDCSLICSAYARRWEVLCSTLGPKHVIAPSTAMSDARHE